MPDLGLDLSHFQAIRSHFKSFLSRFLLKGQQKFQIGHCPKNKPFSSHFWLPSHFLKSVSHWSRNKPFQQIWPVKRPTWPPCSMIQRISVHSRIRNSERFWLTKLSIHLTKLPSLPLLFRENGTTELQPSLSTFDFCGRNPSLGIPFFFSFSSIRPGLAKWKPALADSAGNTITQGPGRKRG